MEETFTVHIEIHKVQKTPEVIDNYGKVKQAGGTTKTEVVNLTVRQPTIALAVHISEDYLATYLRSTSPSAEVRSRIGDTGANRGSQASAPNLTFD